MKKTGILFLVLGFLLANVSSLFAKELTIVYTGQTHAMLYPCSCPIRQDGGIARRATLIEELRKSDSELVLIDCGSFTAGGALDEYAKDNLLDMQRSLVNLKAMEIMGYDAVGVAGDEFNFGKEYFLKTARSMNPVFLSANIESDKVLPYLLKNVKGTKIGIIGLTGLTARQKAEELKINEPKKIEDAISQLKKKGVRIIILISNLGEKEDLKLISYVQGIDILFVGQNPVKDEPLTKVGSTFMVRPSWQGRKLGKLDLEVKNGNLIGCKAKLIDISDKVKDSTQIQAILPHCFSDFNCRREGFIGLCKNGGDLKAECEFIVPKKISLTVITAKECTVCNAERIVNSLKRKFPGLVPEYLNYPDPPAQKFIKEFSITALPVFIFEKEIEQDPAFGEVKSSFIEKDGLYMLKPSKSGLSFFINRKKKPGKFDLFFSLFDKDTDKLLSAVREFQPELHFLAVENKVGFDAKKGSREIDEYLRGVCVQKYCPEQFWDYLICRIKNISGRDWENCLSCGDLNKVKTCSTGGEGKKLLTQNISLNNQLEILFGPAYLLENQEIFSSVGVPDKEELRKIIKKK